MPAVPHRWPAMRPRWAEAPPSAPFLPPTRRAPPCLAWLWVIAVALGSALCGGASRGSWVGLTEPVSLWAGWRQGVLRTIAVGAFTSQGFAEVAEPAGAYPRAKRVTIDTAPALLTIGSEERRRRLDTELATMGINASQLSTEEFLGGSAERAYRSFVFPRSTEALAIADDPNRVRVIAQQVAFLVREQRAHDAAYLRNVDLRQRERQATALQTFPLTIVLDNVRSAENVGMMFRVAETAGVAELITCGFTPHPPNPKLLKTALSAAEYVPTRHFPSTAAAVRALRAEGVEVWACETTAD
eukprot:EG_transcript_20315